MANAQLCNGQNSSDCTKCNRHITIFVIYNTNGLLKYNIALWGLTGLLNYIQIMLAHDFVNVQNKKYH